MEDELRHYFAKASALPVQKMHQYVKELAVALDERADTLASDAEEQQGIALLLESERARGASIALESLADLMAELTADLQRIA